MKRNCVRFAADFSHAAVLVIAISFPFTCCGQTGRQNQENRSKRPYTIVEYNSFAESYHVKAPTEKIALLDSFVAKFADSSLLIYVYEQYVEAYKDLADNSKVMEYAEKICSSNEKLRLDVNTRFEVLAAWVQAYNNLRSNDVVLAAKAREMCRIGLSLLESIDVRYVNQKAFPEELGKAKLYLNATTAAAAMTMKDYEAAGQSLPTVVALGTYDPSKLRPASTPAQR